MAHTNAVMSAIGRHSRRVRVVKPACEFLARVSECAAKCVALTPHVDVVSSTMTAHGDNVVIVKACLQLLRNLAASDASRAAVVAHIEHVVSILGRHVEVADMVEAVMSVLRNASCGSEADRRSLMAHMSSVVPSLARHVGDVRVARQGVRLFFNLLGTAANVRALRSLGAKAVVRSALDQHFDRSRESEIRTCCEKLLAAL